MKRQRLARTRASLLGLVVSLAWIVVGRNMPEAQVGPIYDLGADGLSQVHASR